jgi:hypothetical protein
MEYLAIYLIYTSNFRQENGKYVPNITMFLPVQFLGIFVWSVTKTIIKFSYSIRLKPNQCLSPSTIEKVSFEKLYKYNQ